MSGTLPGDGERNPRHPKLLESGRAVLLIIDVQKVLIPFIWQSEKLLLNIGYVIEVARIHDIPTIVTEHNPAGLGVTDDQLVDVLKETGVGYHPLHKNIFSCCGHSDFIEAVKATGRQQVIVVGMESHICVNQTVLDLLHHGYEVHVVEDAIRARWENSHNIAMEKMRGQGAIICDWEMAAYELTYGAKTEQFKSLLSLMKRAKADYDAGTGVS